MQDNDYTEGLLQFIDGSPTPFHATTNIASRLLAAGFEELMEGDSWPCKADGSVSGKFFVRRNGSSIIAFTLSSDASENGFHMVGAHTDSPCLKVKPNPEIVNEHYLQLGVEVYGGALLNPWFDRDLSLAGRVTYLDADGQMQDALIDFETAIAVIPSLAIHLDRGVNDKREINKQKHLPPLLMKLPQKMSASKDVKAPSLRQLLQDWMQARADAPQVSEILDYELSFYDTQPSAVTGLHSDFISAARLDNLLSCYTGLMALLDEDGSRNCLLVCNDHEEVGSMSAAGAQGPFLKSLLERLCPDAETYARAIDRSMMISADNAHGIHPNYPDRHDEHHGPVLNEGPVIKVNSNQRYATDSQSAAAFRRLCRQADVPVQAFVTRSDMGCGSTIGPITASNIGVDTVDVGVPTFAMHSIREMAGRWDGYYLYRVLREFYTNQSVS